MTQMKWTKAGESSNAEPLAECIGEKLPHTVAALIAYYGDDGLLHYHCHLVDGGRDATAEFLELLRDDYIPNALKSLRS